MSQIGNLLRCFGLASLTMASAAAYSVAIAAGPIPAPIGLDVDGTAFAMVSNAGWKVADASGAKTAAKRVAVLLPRSTGATSALGRQEYDSVWAPTCTAAAQTLFFTRRYFLPGPAKTFGAQIAPRFSGSISRVLVLINGQAAFAFNNGQGDIVASANRSARLLRFGDNDIEVRVTKVAKSKFLGSCTGGVPPKALGIQFNFYGEFEANVAVSKAATGSNVLHVYVTADEDSTLAIIPFAGRYKSMVNLGPSGLYRGTLILSLSSGPSTTKLEVGKLAIRGGQIKNCKESSLHERHWQLLCDVERWAKGATPGVTFETHTSLITGPDTAKTFDLYGEAHLYPKTSDPKIDSNNDYFRITICRPSATDPNCP